MMKNSDIQRLKNLLVNVIDDSTRYIWTKKRTLNCITDQIDRGLSIITIHVGNSESGQSIVSILGRFSEDEQQTILKKIIAEEYKIDLLEYTIKVKQ
ncbi:hypothetical protein [Candidatus Nitrosocosmicus sp. SS]|jgi:hypothetical protein|uniref:hypothetical protein n=1 Tax=Candidatus Nitrosocosmicus agrestis TaxID=2563600 RepID=UPI00122DF73A|nr:hypothetical protein [Candidatus Nitrosocosmicus sp. SS]KAA2283746.1 hypothetical protein F1Z66_00190 [Candidatus Nitrosocosmicus sp. SS]KAF0870122.1 hypothetical protein E5N71_00915 [Candidatus Nitrosocosmicus sp. SS]